MNRKDHQRRRNKTDKAKGQIMQMMGHIVHLCTLQSIVYLQLMHKMQSMRSR